MELNSYGFVLNEPGYQTVQGLGCGLDDRGSLVRFPAGPRELSLLLSVEAGSWALQTSHSYVGGGAFFLRVNIQWR